MDCRDELGEGGLDRVALSFRSGAAEAVALVEGHLFAGQKREGIGQRAALLGGEAQRVRIGHRDGDNAASEVTRGTRAGDGDGQGLGFFEGDTAWPGALGQITGTLAAGVLRGQSYGRGSVFWIEGRCCGGGRHDDLLHWVAGVIGRG